MNNFIELSEIRCSVRKYADQLVEEEKLKKILEAGRLAPTAANYQPQRIYVLKSASAIAEIRSITRMVYNAPIVLLVCYDNNTSWKNSFGDEFDAGEMDASIVTTMMMMEATELGLGTLWVRAYNSEEIVEKFQLPENIKPVCLLLVGYASKDFVPNEKMHLSRLPLSETVMER